MAKRSIIFSNLVGPGVVPGSAPSRSYVDIAPAYAFVDGTAINWPVPVRQYLTGGTLTVAGVEDTYLGQPVAWAFKVVFEDERGIVTGSYAEVRTFPVGTGSIAYSALIEVDLVSLPGFGPSWAAQAKASADAAAVSADAAAVDAANVSTALSTKMSIADNDAAVAGYISTAGTSATKTALSATFDQRGWLASEHGVVGDGVVDDAPAFASLLTEAAAAGATVILAANSVLSIKSRIYPPSNTRIDGQGATIRNDMTASTGDALLWLDNVSNVLIERVNIDGNKAAYSTATEWKHGISMTQASRVTLRDVTSNRNKGDGVYVGGTVTTYCSDIVLERVTCDENHRQGLSIVSVIGFEASNSKFTRTAGTNPQCGLDIEPNTADAPVERIKFTACEFTGNAAEGIAVAAWKDRTIKQGDVDFIGCTVDGNLLGGVKLITGDGIRFLGGSISKNTGKGVWFSASAGNTTDVQFTGTKITGNTGKGILMDTPCQGLTLNAVRAYGNTTEAASLGVDLLPVSAATDIKIIGCTFGGATQTHGLRTGSNVSNLTLVGNTYLDAPTPVSLSDDVATRVRVEGTGGNLIAATTTRSATGSVGAGFRSTTDTFDKVLLRTDGLLTFGSGTVAVDTQLSRVVANVLGTGTDDCFRTGLALTDSRPSASAVGAGAQFFDNTLKRPIWSDGSVWKDAAGVAV